MVMYRSVLSVMILSMALVCALPQHSFAEVECQYKVGIVPQFEQRRLFNTWTPILEGLKEKTGCAFELVGSRSIIEFEEKFKAGDFDMAYMNPYHAVMARQNQNYQPIVRSSARKLKGILVVRKDDPITDVSALDKKKIAFPSPNALGASLLMRAELAQKHNVNPETLYVKTHSSVYLHVAKGLAEAGGGVGRTLREQPDHIQNALRILYTTTPVNPHPIVIHPRVSKEKQVGIQTALLAIAEEKPEAFGKIPMAKPVAASYQDYKDLDSLGLENFIGTKD